MVLDGNGAASGIQVVPEPIRSIETPSGPFIEGADDDVTGSGFIPGITECCADAEAGVVTCTTKAVAMTATNLEDMKA